MYKYVLIFFILSNQTVLADYKTNLYGKLDYNTSYSLNTEKTIIKGNIKLIPNICIISIIRKKKNNYKHEKTKVIQF